MPEPYLYVRAITLGLGTLWGILAILRVMRFAREWAEKLAPWGFDPSWVKRQVVRLALRATVFDPWCVALSAVLVGTWLLRRWIA